MPRAIGSFTHATQMTNDLQFLFSNEPQQARGQSRKKRHVGVGPNWIFEVSVLRPFFASRWRVRVAA